MDTGQGIAILLFSRSPEQEGQQKKWLFGRASNVFIAQQLIHSTRQVLEATGLPVFQIDESRQNGSTFGEKFANAFDDLFLLGFESVISVGNDTPELDQTDWVQVVSALKAGQNVVGPDLRKGAYLVALNQSGFDKEYFKGLPWQSSRLIDQLITYCRNPLLLDKKRDLNTWTDLRIAARTNSLIRRIIRKVTIHQFGKNPETGAQYPANSPTIRGLRAPPVLAR